MPVFRAIRPTLFFADRSKAADHTDGGIVDFESAIELMDDPEARDARGAMISTLVDLYSGGVPVTGVYLAFRAYRKAHILQQLELNAAIELEDEDDLGAVVAHQVVAAGAFAMLSMGSILFSLLAGRLHPLVFEVAVLSVGDDQTPADGVIYGPNREVYAVARRILDEALDREGGSVVIDFNMTSDEDSDATPGLTTALLQAFPLSKSGDPEMNGVGLNEFDQHRAAAAILAGVAVRLAAKNPEQYAWKAYGRPDQLHFGRTEIINDPTDGIYVMPGQDAQDEAEYN